MKIEFVTSLYVQFVFNYLRNVRSLICNKQNFNIRIFTMYTFNEDKDKMFKTSCLYMKYIYKIIVFNRLCEKIVTLEII